MSKQVAWYQTFFSGLYSQVLGAQYAQAETLAEAHLIKRLLKLRTGQKALDIPCGKGRISIPLAHERIDVTGVDLTAEYISTAQRRARQARVAARFICSDMRDIDFAGEFHAAYNWFGSFGYFSDEDNLLFCRTLHTALRPGGRLLIQGPNKSWIATHFIPDSEHNISGTRITIHNRWDRKKQRIQGIWRFSRAGRTETKATDMRIYNAAEMRQILRLAGFVEVTCYDQTGGRFTRHSRKLLVVARKEL
jgi:SAM-dependent methyltransferase